MLQRVQAEPEVARPPAAATLTHYCITRRDLSAGLQAANLIHAAGESSPGNLPDTTYAVALTVPDEPALRSLARKLALAGVRHCAIIETEGPHAGQMMSIGIAPAPRSQLKKHLSMYPLLK